MTYDNIIANVKIKDVESWCKILNAVIVMVQKQGRKLHQTRSKMSKLSIRNNKKQRTTHIVLDIFDTLLVNKLFVFNLCNYTRLQPIEVT